VSPIFHDSREGRKTSAEKAGADRGGQSGGIPGGKFSGWWGYGLGKIARGKSAVFHGIPGFWCHEKSVQGLKRDGWGVSAAQVLGNTGM